ncbi:hypothetical protein ACFW9D_07310 [Streptomyces sp. NPDC059524]|uniref:hypothetical protein n=1 Tax=Streptomyces sp. NPDC059524 TaxID=3346856 RepID=UPI0036B2E742
MPNELSVVDRLSVLPFPAGRTRPSEEDVWGGPGHHLAVLRESRDFWDSRDEEIVEAAEQEIESAHTALAARLTGRWGAPHAIELWPYLETDGPVPEPMGFLSCMAGSVQVWRLPATDRWIGLAVGQADPEWPIQLLLAVGETAVLPEN